MEVSHVTELTTAESIYEDLSLISRIDQWICPKVTLITDSLPQPKNTDANSSADADSPWCAHQAVSTFGASQNQSRIGHVIAQVDVRSSTEDASSFLQRDVGFNRNGVGPNHRPGGTSLALDLPALCVPAGGANTDKRTRVDTQTLNGNSASTQRSVSQRER